MKPFLIACRSLARRPGFALVATLTLAFGVAATTAVFSVVDTVLIKPLPFPDADRLVSVMEANPSKRQATSLIAPARLEDWNRASTTFAGLSGWYAENVTDTSGAEPERLAGRRVAARFFTVFGMPALVGRTFTPDEERAGGAQTAVISEGFWARRYGRDPAAIGARLILGGQGYTIVGVMPRTFTSAAIDVWLPAQFPPALLTLRPARFLSGVGRMKPGVTIQQAQNDLQRVQERLGEQYPDSDKGWSATVGDWKEQRVVGDYRRALTLVFAAVGLLLAIAVANIAGLMLVQLRRRARELSIRQAIGGSRRQVVADLMREVTVIAAAGAVAGAAGAQALVTLFARLFATVPRMNELAIDWRALAFTAIASALAAMAFGLGPALRVTSVDLAPQLSEGGRGASGARHWLQSALVVAQIALTVLLIGSAGLMLRSYYNLIHVDTGLDPASSITFHVGAAWNEDRTRVGQMQVAIVDALQQTPGVVAAGFTNFLPASGATLRYQVTLEGRSTTEDNGKITIGERSISGAYLPAIGVPLAAGSWCPPLRFDARVNPFDARGQTKAIVNRAFAERYGPDLIGRHVTIDQSNDPWEIVGIIGNVAEDGPAAAPMPYVYACIVPGAWPDPEYVVRVRGDLAGAMARVRQVVRGVAPGRAIFGMQPLEQVLAGALDQPRLDASVLTVFATAALTLAALGLYSLLMLLVSERARELGVRMALGATAGQVVRLVLGGAFRLVAGGAVAGLVLSAALARLLRSVLFGVDPLDASTLAAAVATLTVVALVAAAIPAGRAARIDPIDAMRVD